VNQRSIGINILRTLVAGDIENHLYRALDAHAEAGRVCEKNAHLFKNISCKEGGAGMA